MTHSNWLFVFSLVSTFVMVIASIVIEDYSLIFYAFSPLVLAVLARNFDLDKFRKNIISKVNTTVSVMLILAVAILTTKASVNGIYDFSSDSSNTLSSQTVSIVEGLKNQDSKVEFRTYFTDKARQTKFRNLIALFQAVYGNIRVKNFDPVEDSLKAKKDLITKADTFVIEINGKVKKVDRVSEKIIAESLLSLVNWKKKKVYFLVGHGEGLVTNRGKEGYSDLYAELVSNRYIVKSVNLLNGEFSDIPDILIINNPQYELSAHEVEMIGGYIERGMSLVVLSEALKPIGRLNELTSKFGLKFESNYLFLHPKDPRVKLIGQDVAVVDELGKHEINQSITEQSSLTLLFPQSRSINMSVKNRKMFQVFDIASSHQSSFAINRVNNLEDFKKKNTGDLEAGNFILAAVSQGMNGRLSSTDNKLNIADRNVSIAMFGSSKFINNVGIQRGENIDLFMNTISNLLSDQHLAGIRSKDKVEYFLRNTSLRSSIILIFISYIFPVLCSLMLLSIWYRRRVA